MLELIDNNIWKETMGAFGHKGICNASNLLNGLIELMDGICEEPDCGWLKFICDYTVSYMYPENFTCDADDKQKQAMMFFLESYRTVLKEQAMVNDFAPTDYLYLLDEEETEECVNLEEYNVFREIWDEYYLFEYMRINREITPFNTIGHIGGVHHVAVFIGKQLLGTDVPVDISLVSAAAAGHDLGKFGCRPEEATRVPYLHYYYTNVFLNREGMPMIAHIASNHSTWDLELENLSVESLLLIYADFRVKSVHEDGNEIICFYTLDEAFNVILSKLDNVDNAKRQRYERVYAKLKDFEDYLINLGVETDINKKPAIITGESNKDFALMSGDEVVNNIKFTAIEHNIKIMSIFNNESAFGSLIEAARSESQWKNQRAYLDILDEYYTYMTKQEKTITLSFLYELLSHREGDIRRQAGHLLGTIIAKYDDVYTKELPDMADKRLVSSSESVDVWQEYMRKLVFPDYRIIDRHKSWIGYAFRSVLFGVFENVDADDIQDYLDPYIELFLDENIPVNSVFTLLNTVAILWDEYLTDTDLNVLTEFAIKCTKCDDVAVVMAAYRAMEHLTEHKLNSRLEALILKNLDNNNWDEYQVGFSFIKFQICENLGIKSKSEYYLNQCNNIEGDDSSEDSISLVLRENLKVGTPWVVKAANIAYIMYYSNSIEAEPRMYHLATHFSNLIKVSEIVTIRRRAGNKLLKIAHKLHMDQINEIVIELSKGLEIGEYQFSKYIPEFLGQLALYLYPNELDEFIISLGTLIESNNEKVGSVALDTVGVILQKYSTYKHKNYDKRGNYVGRQTNLLGMLLKGLSNYHEIVSQEAFMVIGNYIFGNNNLSMDEKMSIFKHINKKTLTLISLFDEFDMNFFNNAAALNNIYRFISEYIFVNGKMELNTNEKIAFFPGTFDPFSLSHKGIVQSIRNEGFEVYLALDEFSWSKKTQARMLRKKIITMSVADEPDVYMFPDDFPVNIANPGDLKNLKDLFPGKKVYIVVGSDVITNASSYRAVPRENSIHSMNHVVFRRESLEEGEEDEIKLQANYENITGDILELKLPMHLEDISSTRIRDNIDQGRDISNLIDNVAQNFIYDNSLYLREPQYKSILEKGKIKVVPLRKENASILKNLEPELIENELNVNIIRDYINRDYVNVATVEDNTGQVWALAAVNIMETRQLYNEFQNIDIAEYLRKKVTGRMLVIRGLYCNRRSDIDNIVQILSTEVISQALAKDITYAIYHPVTGGINRHIREIIERMGFRQVYVKGEPENIFEVNMKEPMAVIQNLDTVLKAPFSSNPDILDVLQTTHGTMQKAIAELNPGNLVLSFNEGILREKIVDMVTKTNGVPNYPLKPRVLGEYMCVPFGKTLEGMVVPNTVTKTIHTEKVFSPTLNSFDIKEYPQYATLANQIKTIKSFGRPVILVDDFLHKGYRLKSLDKYFNNNGIEIKKIITGMLSGYGKDLMDVQGREVESAYFVPNLKAWFVESAMCPFIGGDGIETEAKTQANLIPSINQMLPFAAMPFLEDCQRNGIYQLSLTCLENALEIFKVLEDVYQEEFERKLTIKRLSDAVKSPRMPNGSNQVEINFNLSPSVYVSDYIQKLISLESAFK